MLDEQGSDAGSLAALASSKGAGAESSVFREQRDTARCLQLLGIDTHSRLHFYSACLSSPCLVVLPAPVPLSPSSLRSPFRLSSLSLCLCLFRL
jgi:hypothetical protein